MNVIYSQYCFDMSVFSDAGRRSRDINTVDQKLAVQVLQEASLDGLSSQHIITLSTKVIFTDAYGMISMISYLLSENYFIIMYKKIFWPSWNVCLYMIAIYHFLLYSRVHHEDIRIPHYLFLHGHLYCHISRTYCTPLFMVLPPYFWASQASCHIHHTFILIYKLFIHYIWILRTPQCCMNTFST